MKIAKIKDADASLIPSMISGGIVNPAAKICRHGTMRYVPIYDEREDDAAGMGFEVIDGDAFTRETRTPQNRIRERLAHLPADVLLRIPMKWEFVGDIVILKLNDNAFAHAGEIGKVYGSELDAKTVCADRGGVSGELRRPRTEIIFGDDPESVRLENGIKYKFDVTKIMFASGNTAERNRMRHLDCRNETIIDMFAGIGYFSLPVAKFTGAKKVIACEKNPDSFFYLKENIRINGIGNIEPVMCDNRSLEHKDADRIIMGYVQKTSQFLQKAKEMIRHGGMIHYHDTFYVNEYEARINAGFAEVFGNDGYEIQKITEVKSFAPSVSHYVADVKIS